MSVKRTVLVLNEFGVVFYFETKSKIDLSAEISKSTIEDSGLSDMEEGELSTFGERKRRYTLIPQEAS